MDSDRPPPTNRSITTSTSTHLFFCFTSSSSMKISSKSILSPGRAGSARDPPPISLSNSVSRRLRNSRSIKGGASPAMFPVTGKKRGCGFDNPEPSSPKVTCIGQVRVKSKKKHAKNVRTLSRRRNAGDVNFRKLEHSRSQSQHLECLQGQRNNNQRWVHLPLTICETLKAFGSEVSCLFPCRSSCSSTTAMEKEEKMDVGEEGNRLGSYGAMSARWLVDLQDGDGGGRDAYGDGGQREIELVAGDDDEEMDFRNTRRHVFENLEIVNGDILGSKDEARVSICVPPKNALLLMRCRSDPMMMEALTNRFWEPAVEIHEVKEEDEESAHFDDKIEENIIPQEHLQLQEDEKHMVLDEVNDQEHDDLQEHEVNQELAEIDSKMEMEQTAQEEKLEMKVKQSTQEEEDNEQSIEAIEEEEEEEGNEQSIEAIEEEEEEDESMFLWSLFAENGYQAHEFENNEEEDAQLDMEDARESFENEDVQETETGESNIEKVELFEEQNEEMVTEFAKRTEIPDETHEEIEVENGVLEREDEEIEKSSKELPECLLLMMYEPKLSMEVSKETWVCSSDFIRRHSGRKKPPHPPPPPPQPPQPFESMESLDESKINPSPKEHEDFMMIQNQLVSQQPARSSCSFPAPPTMAAMLEQKLVNNMGFEPLVLTRCKSEPMRTAATKLAPETCFWRNKLEPPRRASFGMAGLGF